MHQPSIELAVSGRVLPAIAAVAGLALHPPKTQTWEPEQETPTKKQQFGVSFWEV